jgi:hypothetical protein
MRNGEQVAYLAIKHWWNDAEFDLVWNGNSYGVDSDASSGQVFSRELGGKWSSNTEAVVDVPLDADIAAYLAYRSWRRRHP